jgi:TetR/AcrR family transcriptional regulator
MRLKDDTSTEQKILNAARKIFVDKGLDGARMQDIAEEAGINKAMLHYYFRSKDKLFETIFNELAGEFLPKIFAIMRADIPLFEKIEKFCEAYIQQEIKTPYVPMFIIKEVNRDPNALIKRILSTQQPPLGDVIAQIKSEIAKGTIRHIEPVELLLNTLSLCIFPFLVRPMVQTITGMDVPTFNAVMERRATTVSKMIIDSIKT